MCTYTYIYIPLCVYMCVHAHVSMKVDVYLYTFVVYFSLIIMASNSKYGATNNYIDGMSKCFPIRTELTVISSTDLKSSYLINKLFFTKISRNKYINRKYRNRKTIQNRHILINSTHQKSMMISD